MPKQATDDTVDRSTRLPAPLFDPDPEIVGHREGNKREIKRYQRAMVKFRDEVQAEQLRQAHDALMSVAEDELRAVEVARLRSLVDRDMTTAQRLHADDYLLITPRGAGMSKTEYLGAVESGALSYARFEPVSEIDVLAGDGAVAVVRYKSAIEVDSDGGRFSAVCWHTDCYRRDASAGWQAVWSQATAIESTVD